jgi:2-polyprenyl-6-hydroxyphenyl methylase/3-demethylubiquinone-9 3-methyltransferase
MNQRNNADPAELARFDAVADDWWNPEGQFAPLHRINPLRVRYVTDQLDLFGTRVLDVGCGGGILTEALALRGARMTGLDLSPGPLRVARDHALEQGLDIDYVEAAAEDFADLHPETFDAVCCMEMLEHVPDPASVLKAMARLVKPGGKIFLSTINRTPKAFVLAIVGAEYVLNWVPRGTHTYEKFIRPSELGQGVREAGLVMNDVTGMHYNPLTRRFSLGRDTDVNYLATATRIPL